MDVSDVDPRDVSYEISDPTFRVYFWRKQDIAGTDPASAGYVSYEYEIRGGDVLAVIEWATDIATREGKSYTLYLVLDKGDEKGLALLAGTDPTKATS